VRAAGHRVVLYGCLASTLVDGLALGGLINFAVDDQTERQGRHMPDSGLEIHPSENLDKDVRPTVYLLAVNNENDAKV